LSTEEKRNPLPDQIKTTPHQKKRGAKRPETQHTLRQGSVNEAWEKKNDEPQEK